MKNGNWQRATRTAALSLVLAWGCAQAQSEASVELSALPLASAVGAASAVSALPLALGVSGAVLVVKAVDASAQGVVVVLERVSDGIACSIALSGTAARSVSMVVGTVVVVSVVSTGVVLSAAGQVVAFLPNGQGRSLLHNERVTY